MWIHNWWVYLERQIPCNWDLTRLRPGLTINIASATISMTVCSLYQNQYSSNGQVRFQIIQETECVTLTEWQQWAKRAAIVTQVTNMTQRSAKQKIHRSHGIKISWIRICWFLPGDDLDLCWSSWSAASWLEEDDCQLQTLPLKLFFTWSYKTEKM